jgi:hypothetical protein
VDAVSLEFLSYCMENKSDPRQVLSDHGLDPFLK